MVQNDFCSQERDKIDKMSTKPRPTLTLISVFPNITWLHCSLWNKWHTYERGSSTGQRCQSSAFRLIDLICFSLSYRSPLLLLSHCRVVAGRSFHPRDTSSKWQSTYPTQLMIILFTIILLTPNNESRNSSMISDTAHTNTCLTRLHQNAQLMSNACRYFVCVLFHRL